MRRPALALGDLPGLERLDRTTRRVVGLVLFAAAVRLAFLGSRVAHYDEGRVAWWSQHFLETGAFEYRYIIHGPFAQHVDKVVFGALGANDFAMRLVVAAVGALLPLTALLFREHLDGDEVVGVAFFLALNPVLVYYSRFFRSTLLVAAFAFVAFGFLVRAYDEREARYVHAAVVFVALAFTAKENAAVYVLCWLGASALLVDHVLFRTGADESGFDWLFGREATTDGGFDRYRAALPRYLGHLALAAVLFVAVSLYFYAPRSPNSDAVGFWAAVWDPTLLPALFERTLDDIVVGYEHWFGGSSDPGCNKDNLIDGYLCYLGRSLESLGRYALPLMVLSAVGFVAERYGRSRPRYLVVFAGYWGYVSVLGYPLGTDIYGAWILVNALVPLAIPAGVGLALLVRRATAAFAADDSVRFGIVAFVLLLVLGQIAVALAGGVYLNPTSDENELVQYAQPADDFRPAMRVLEDRAGDHDGTDVLFVGSEYVRNDSRVGGIEPRCTRIINALPLQWYVGAYGATGECERSADAAVEHAAEHDPLVVIAPRDQERTLEPALDGYDAETHRLRTYGSEAVFFTDRSAAGNETTG